MELGIIAKIAIFLPCVVLPKFEKIVLTSDTASACEAWAQRPKENE